MSTCNICKRPLTDLGTYTLPCGHEIHAKCTSYMTSLTDGCSACDSYEVKIEKLEMQVANLVIRCLLLQNLVLQQANATQGDWS